MYHLDTGGGDARAAENIWQSIRHVQDTYKKPIIASFGNVCASGGNRVIYIILSDSRVLCGCTL